MWGTKLRVFFFNAGMEVDRGGVRFRKEGLKKINPRMKRRKKSFRASVLRVSRSHALNPSTV